MPVAVADTGPASWDLGPGAEGHHGVPPYYLRCAPTVLHFLLSRSLSLCPSSVCGFPPGGLQSARQPFPKGCRTALRPAVKVGERFLSLFFLGDFLWLCLRLPFPQKERELCRQALELLPSLAGGGSLHPHPPRTSCA